MSSVSDLAPPDTGNVRFQRLQLGVVALGIIVILAFAGSSAHDAWRSYQYSLAATDRELTNMANALAEQTVWSLQADDLLLADTVRWYRGESQKIRPEDLNAALAARTSAVPQVREVIIMDAQGNQLHRSRAFTAPNHNAADRSYFIAQRDDPGAGMFISEPLITRTEGRTAVILSRRLDDDQGRFAGVVIANVDLEDLNQFYRTVDMGAGSAVQLLRDDGTLLVRNPRVPDVVGRKFPVLSVAPAEPHATVLSPIDGRADFIAVAPVRNTPLRLAVTRDAYVALKPWRDETIRAAVRALIMTLLSALALAVMMRQIRLEKQAQIDKEQLESQLRQSQKMEAIGTLAGGIAHDFNNVLGAILGYGELALRRAAGDRDLERYLDNVMHAAERAKLLVERILGFSRSGLGDRVLVNVQSVVKETVELLEASLPVGIRIESTLAAGAAAVWGDPTYLHQVTMNLCTNAVQSMDGGGVMEVTLERTELTEARTLSRGPVAPGDYVRLCVSDTGAGIPPAMLERIFDPFFTTKQVGEGTGLGLSVVHGIVSDLGGAIDVSSSVGQGTRFEIWLPVAGEAAMPTLEPPETLPHGNGETLLIVDDERPLVALAEEVVAGLGYEPVGFVSSRLALEAFRAAPDRFDAVLTDESMPDLMGIELVRQIRALRPAIPAILMSGHGDARLVSRARDIGIDEVLRKPLHARDIAEALGRLLGSGPQAMNDPHLLGPHILVVDDDPQIRSLLTEYLGENGLRVSAASNGQAMSQILADEAIDLVILDLRLANEDGLAIVRSLRERLAIPVVMLTGVREEADRVMGLELGADDYVTKPFSPRELLARIRTVLRRARQSGADPVRRREVRAYRFGEFELNLRTRRLKRQDGRAVNLTNGELNLLAALLAAPERILTRDQLLEASRLHDNEVFDRAIDIQVLRLRRKIEADPAQPRYIVTERGVGYIFSAPVEVVY